jgi:hypothetical protein
MAKFVDSRPVPISDDGEGDQKHTIFIRPKMDFGTKTLVIEELYSLNEQAEGSIHLGRHRLALMKHNVVAWDGPDFTGVPCTPDTICKLDPDDPLVERVLEEIATRNPVLSKEAAKTNEKNSTTAGVPGSTDAANASQREPGISTSP